MRHRKGPAGAVGSDEFSLITTPAVLTWLLLARKWAQWGSTPLNLCSPPPNARIPAGQRTVPRMPKGQVPLVDVTTTELDTALANRSDAPGIEPPRAHSRQSVARVRQRLLTRGLDCAEDPIDLQRQPDRPAAESTMPARSSSASTRMRSMSRSWPAVVLSRSCGTASISQACINS